MFRIRKDDQNADIEMSIDRKKRESFTGFNL